VTLHNGGTGAQVDNPGDEFTDALPAGLAFVSVTASSGTATFAAGTVHWNGAIAAGANVTITITASILPTASGTIVNQGTIFFDADGNGTNESSRLTDDPALPGATDGTAFVVAAAAAVVAAPLLDGFGALWLALGLLALAAGTRRLRKRGRV
jgi:uncharacterized repeat protein (TIGR01451 family)